MIEKSISFTFTVSFKIIPPYDIRISGFIDGSFYIARTKCYTDIYCNAELEDCVVSYEKDLLSAKIAVPIFEYKDCSMYGNLIYKKDFYNDDTNGVINGYLKLEQYEYDKNLDINGKFSYEKDYIKDVCIDGKINGISKDKKEIYIPGKLEYKKSEFIKNCIDGSLYLSDYNYHYRKDMDVSLILEKAGDIVRNINSSLNLVYTEIFNDISGKLILEKSKYSDCEKDSIDVFIKYEDNEYDGCYLNGKLELDDLRKFEDMVALNCRIKKIELEEDYLEIDGILKLEDTKYEKNCIIGSLIYDNVLGVKNTYFDGELVLHDQKYNGIELDVKFKVELDKLTTDLDGRIKILTYFYAKDILTRITTRRLMYANSIFTSIMVPKEIINDILTTIEITDKNRLMEFIDGRFEIENINYQRYVEEELKPDDYIENSFVSDNDGILSDDYVITSNSHQYSNVEKIYPPNEIHGKIEDLIPFAYSDIDTSLELDKDYTEKDIITNIDVVYGIEHDMNTIIRVIPRIPYPWELKEKHHHHHNIEFSKNNKIKLDIPCYFSYENEEYYTNNNENINGLPKMKIIIVVEPFVHYDPFVFKNSLITFLERHYRKIDPYIFYGGNDRANFDITNLCLNYKIPLPQLYRIPIDFNCVHHISRFDGIEKFIISAFSNEILEYPIGRVFLFMKDPMSYYNSPIGKIAMVCRKLDISCVCIGENGNFVEILERDIVEDLSYREKQVAKRTRNQIYTYMPNPANSILIHDNNKIVY